MKVVNSILKIMDKLAKFIIITLMASMSVVAFTAVFFRFILNNPLSWSEEAARYMMAWVTFMGAGLAMGQKRHIGVTLIVSRLSKRVRLAINTFAELIIAIFMVILIWQGIKLVWDLRTQVSPAMHFPMIIPYLCIPIGCFYILLHTIRLLLERTSDTLSTADAELTENTFKGGTKP